MNAPVRVPVFASTGLDKVRGVQRVLSVATPAVATDWVLTLPPGSWWRLLIGRATFVTDANAANRTTGLLVTDQNNTLGRHNASGNLVANTTYGLTYTPQITSLTGGLIGTELTVTLFNMFLQGGFQIKSVSSSLQVGDQFSNINFLAEEIDLGPWGEPIHSGTTFRYEEIDDLAPAGWAPHVRRDPLPRRS